MGWVVFIYARKRLDNSLLQNDEFLAGVEPIIQAWSEGLDGVDC